MGWVEAVGEAVQYVEDHITEELSAEEIAKQVNISPFYFQKGFAMLCGFTLGEYIRNRRLALAGSELASGNGKVIDIALKYGYDSPDSFAKAFTRFHGVTPLRARKEQVTLKSFAPAEDQTIIRRRISHGLQNGKKGSIYSDCKCKGLCL